MSVLHWPGEEKRVPGLGGSQSCLSLDGQTQTLAAFMQDFMFFLSKFGCNLVWWSPTELLEQHPDLTPSLAWETFHQLQAPREAIGFYILS